MTFDHCTIMFDKVRPGSINVRSCRQIIASGTQKSFQPIKAEDKLRWLWITLLFVVTCSFFCPSLSLFYLIFKNKKRNWLLMWHGNAEQECKSHSTSPHPVRYKLSTCKLHWPIWHTHWSILTCLLSWCLPNYSNDEDDAKNTQKWCQMFSSNDCQTLLNFCFFFQYVGSHLWRESV